MSMTVNFTSMFYNTTNICKSFRERLRKIECMCFFIKSDSLYGGAIFFVQKNSKTHFACVHDIACGCGGFQSSMRRL